MASSRQNLSSGLANNKAADQPGHPHRLISAFVIRFLESIYLNLLQAKFQCRFYFLVLWDHRFHSGTLKLLEGH